MKEVYKKEIVPALTKQFGYKSVMEVPRVSKVVLNMGVGEAVGDKKLLENAAADMQKIAGQKPVLYSPSGEAVCSFCAKKEKAVYICPEGHYVCEACRLASAQDGVWKTCEVRNETDPMKIALLLMKHPAIPIHGSENHLVTAYSLLTPLRNSGETRVGKPEFHKANQREKRASHGICGSWGVCGCAIAAGAVFSIITGATYLSDKERSLGLRVASKILDEIAQVGGPRCCKMATYVAISVAAEYFVREGYPFLLRRPRTPSRVFSPN